MRHRADSRRAGEEEAAGVTAVLARVLPSQVIVGQPVPLVTTIMLAAG